MKVSIDEIETKGLRCPDSLISFKNRSNGGVINLLQMPNGTGKTTIIQLLSASLTGKIDKWSPSEVKEYKSKDNLSNDGEFRITLSLESQKVKQLTFLTRFNFEEGSSKIFTTRGNIGEEEGWLPPVELRPFFSTGCVDVFCFQGDKTKDIIDSSKDDAEITIKAFFGFDEIEGFIDEIKKFHRDTIQTGAPVTTSSIAAKTQQAGLWNLRAIELKEDYESLLLLKAAADTNEAELKKTQGKIIEALNGTKKQEELDKAHSAAANNVNEASSDFWNDLKNPLLLSDNLISDLNTFRNSLESMKLPGGSRSFFEELIKEDKGCICGEDLTESRIENIQREIENYLGDDEAMVVNVIKGEIADSYNLRDSNSFNKNYTTLDNALNDRTTALKNKQDYLEEMQKLATPKNQLIFKQYGEIVAEQTKINLAISNRKKVYMVESSLLNDPQSCKSYKTAENTYDRLLEEIGEVTDKKEISESYKILKKVINRAKQNSLIRIKDNLKLKTNEKLIETLPEGSKIEVLEVDKYLKLGWNEVIQSNASGAQSVIIAYSFARSVLEEASVEFPLIVDHPFTQIDWENRKNLGSKLGALMHQFIGFLIDTEREGFLEGVADQVDIRYISLFSSEIAGNANYIKQIEKLQIGDYLKTSNGFITYNKDFFINNKMGDH